MRSKILFILLALLPVTPYSSSASEVPVATKIVDCKNEINCINKSITEAKDYKALADNFKVYITLVKKSESLFESCHTVAHAIGKIAYERYGEKGFVKGQVACQYGFAHGYLVGMSKKIKGEKFVKGGVEVCQSISSLSERSLCYHGVGHGAASAFESFKETVESCLLLKDKNYQNDCVTGGSMERANSVANFPTEFKKQVELCTKSKISSNPTLLRSCLSQVLTYKLYLYDQVVALEKECIKSSASVIAGCYEAMGYIAATYLLPKIDSLAGKVSMGVRVCSKDKSQWCTQSLISRTYSLTDKKEVPIEICKVQINIKRDDCKKIIDKLAS
jgi:hypothetical protein